MSDLLVYRERLEEIAELERLRRQNRELRAQLRREHCSIRDPWMNASTQRDNWNYLGNQLVMVGEFKAGGLI